MKKQVKVGDLTLGDGSVSVQSMTTVKTSDAQACVAQILRLEKAGCDIARVSVLDEADARAIREVRSHVHIPIVADIHFSARLAVLAMESGADKLRVNPGNIGGEEKIKLVADCAKLHKIPIRVGANTGSIEKEFYERYGRSAKALVASVLKRAEQFEQCGFTDLVLSVKSSDVRMTVDAYTMLAEETDYPLHIGVTEAGTYENGIVKSSVGIGALLLRGIGDTVRVSLSADPVLEVRAAHRILRSVGLERNFVEVIACPTCGRCEYDCMGLASRVEEAVVGIAKPLKVAVMGCVVNGPGEAKECDLGIAGGREYCLIFGRGAEPERVPTELAEQEFFRRLTALLDRS